LFSLELLHADHQLGDLVGLVDQRDALGIFRRFVDFAADQQRQEGAAEQFGIIGVALERRPVIAPPRPKHRARVPAWRAAR
jgi:hypothetical protein